MLFIIIITIHNIDSTALLWQIALNVHYKAACDWITPLPANYKRKRPTRHSKKKKKKIAIVFDALTIRNPLYPTHNPLPRVCLHKMRTREGGSE